MQQYENNEEVDAVVIGTGAGGAPLLSRLAKNGLKVIALEAGKQWDPETDYATDERAQTKLFWNYERLTAGANPVPFGNNNSGTGVGGSTLHFTAYTPRPQPDDFRIYSDFGIGKDWPLSYYDLEPYYDELELFLGISGPAPYPWGPARKSSYPFKPLPLNAAAQLMEKGCSLLNIKTSPAANAAVSENYYQPHAGWRHVCTNRGFCQAGCHNKAKASMDVTFIPYALHYGAEVRPECFVTGMEISKFNNVTGVIYRKHGKEERQRCKHVFLCAGGIETPRLLLFNNLANSSGQVGKNFMAHVGLQVWGEFEEYTRPYKGIPGALISEDMHRVEKTDYAGGYLLQSIGVMPVTYASQLVRERKIWGNELRQRMKAYNHVAGINMHGECLPSANNYMELSNERDEMDLPKPVVYFSNNDNEKKIESHGEKIMREIWKLAGAKNVWTYTRNAHIAGTCRMGNSSSEAVVNNEGRCFDIPNLYICDNSVFPSSLSVNPALTIMALSLRTADLFLAHKKRSDR
jgi:choline dehydrogenase-like flavoprotein